MTEPIATIEASYHVKHEDRPDTESCGKIEIYPDWIHDTAGMWYPRDNVVLVVEQ